MRGQSLVERISDGEPAARQVPDTTLDSRPMEGITYLEHLAPGGGGSLDSGPMMGMSCLEPLEQSILHSLWIAQPKECVIEEGSVWDPVLNPVISHTLDSQLMEGNTYLEPGAFGSGGIPGQWTYGGGVVSGTSGAVGSLFDVSCTTG